MSIWQTLQCTFCDFFGECRRCRSAQLLPARARRSGSLGQRRCGAAPSALAVPRQHHSRLFQCILGQGHEERGKAELRTRRHALHASAALKGISIRRVLRSERRRRGAQRHARRRHQVPNKPGVAFRVVRQNGASALDV